MRNVLGRSKLNPTSNDLSLHLNWQQKDALFDRLIRCVNMRATRGRPLLRPEAWSPARILAAAQPHARRAWRGRGSCRDKSRPDGAAGARSAKRKALGGGFDPAEGFLYSRALGGSWLPEPVVYAGVEDVVIEVDVARCA